MKNKRGFTLIELLAVITIIGIVSLLAIPVVTNLIKDASDKVFTSNETLLEKAAENYYKVNSYELPGETSNITYISLDTLIETGYTKEIKNPDDGSIICNGYVKVEKTDGNTFDYTSYLDCGEDFTTTGYSAAPIITLNGSTSATVTQGNTYIDAGATAFDAIDGDITDSMTLVNNVNTSVNGVYTVTCNVTNSSGYSATQVTRTVSVMPPASLATGMIPVYYDELAGVWKKANSTNTNNTWYDYNNQKWANAVTTTVTNRATYQSATVGTTIPMTDINTMFVWLPRYKYLIPAGTGEREIKIIFEPKTITKSTGNAITTYLTHPAFTFGTAELSGIWVGKFETTGTITNSTTAALTIQPDLQSVRNKPVKVMYDVIKNTMQSNTTTYGFTSDNDTHMIKNMEWGAAAYLSQSTYGKYGNSLYAGDNKEIYLNNSSNYYTGRSMGTYGGNGITTSLLYGGAYFYEHAPTGYYTYDGKCALIYTALPAPCNGGSIGQVLNDKTLAYGASTSGTIYGIYDMSGGAPENVMGMYKPNPVPVTGLSDSSGYSSVITNSQYDLLTIDSKYYTQYLNSLLYTSIILGDATGEVRGWYSDALYDLSTGYPWVVRGDSCGSNKSAGIFGLRISNGVSSAIRIVLAPNN